jgi:hypothetical protein
MIFQSAKEKDMKRILSVGMVLIWAVISGCGESDQETGAMRNPEIETPALQSPEEDEKLVLNNGEKWKADSITNANVAIIESIISNNKPVSLEDYLKAAGEIKQSLNKLIKDCRMKGPDHDALHHWLEPFLATHKQLSEVKTVEEAQAIYKELDAQIRVYPEFFK